MGSYKWKHLTEHQLHRRLNNLDALRKQSQLHCHLDNAVPEIAQSLPPLNQILYSPVLLIEQAFSQHHLLLSYKQALQPQELLAKQVLVIVLRALSGRILNCLSLTMKSTSLTRLGLRQFIPSSPINRCARGCRIFPFSLSVTILSQREFDSVSSMMNGKLHVQHNHAHTDMY